MKTVFLVLGVIAALVGAGVLWLRAPIEQTATALLRGYPVYSFVRLRNETLLREAHREVIASNRLIHRDGLSGPRDRSVTTPNNDTLYSLAFLDLADGPVLLTLPALPDRYHSVAVMDARTDNAILLGSREGGSGGRVSIAYAADRPGCDPVVAGELRRCRVQTREAWLLVRVLVDSEADVPAARLAQRGFVLEVPDAGKRPPPEVVLLPAVPDPATLIDTVQPLLLENAHLQSASLQATGHGPSAKLWEDLPLWRQWLWRILTPRVFERMREGIAGGSTATDDGWSRSPEGIGTAEASDEIRAAVALAGLGALPKDEAVYWSATVDAERAPLDGAGRYRLTLPADIPARAFWSVSLYERLPDGRLFYTANAIDRYAIGNRTPGLVRAADGSLTLEISADAPAEQANWLPAPKGPFTLIFRAYLPEAPILDGSFRLPPVARIP
jgi:hypothetical protein